MAKTTVDERKPAPEIDVNDPFFDERSYVAKTNERTNPGWKYHYQRFNVTDHELRVKGAEVVKDSDGKPVAVTGGDILCRTPNEVWAKRKERSNAQSLKLAQKDAADGQDVEKVAAPKQPKKRKNEED